MSTTTNIRFFRAPPCLRWLAGSLLVIALIAPVVWSDDRSGSGLSAPWVAPPRLARKQNPLSINAATVAQGKELFTQACQPCHGPTGRGDGPAAATLERNGKPIRPGNLSDAKLWEQTDGTLFWKIGEGNSPMPAFQETYTEEQRWKIVIFLRTLAPKR
jgi:mono/diheme cytochrome c family protein